MSQIENNPTEHEGEHYLRLLGLEHLMERDIETANGIIQARDFLDICGEHARPILVGFERMSTEDPRYDTTKNILSELIGKYVEGDAKKV